MSIKDISLGERDIEILKPCSGEDLLKNDRISDLSDDILVIILSRSLTLKEVGSTSVLSKRWRHVWAYVPFLNFDRDDMFFKKLYSSTREKRKEEEFKYFRWVEQVVNSHKAHTIEEFMIQYELGNSRKDNIDKWIKFAMEKRVKRLQLNIPPVGAFYRALPYTLPNLPPSNTLISLELCGVDVSGEVLNKLLCDFVALESLTVTRSKSLVDLKVAGPSLKLKSLTLRGAITMEHLEIYAPNLISFEYDGEEISWPLMISTPKLVQLSIGGNYGCHVKNDFSELVDILSQIEVFKLNSCGGADETLARVFPVFPVFRKLKILDMKLDPKFDNELFRLCSIIKACPLLHKFALQFGGLFKSVEMTKKTRNLKAFSHPHLKILEIRGFMGREVDIAFILHITKGAALVEKLIVIPYRRWKPVVEEDKFIATEMERLHKVIKPGVELEIREPDLLILYPY